MKLNGFAHKELINISSQNRCVLPPAGRQNALLRNKIWTGGVPIKILFLSLFTTVCINEAIGQFQIKVQISRIDTFGQADTAYFGVDQRATNCIDTSLGEGEIWWQACGLASCLAFIDVRSVSGACLGTGTPVDLRPYYSTTQVDTYHLEFSGYVPMVFHWQHNIASFYNAMTFMNSLDTNAATVKINMLTQDSFVLTIPQFWLSEWYIRAESPHPLSEVPTPEKSLPAAPSLWQNYPNPFNPSTTVGFTLPHEAIVTVTVYDVLGQAVKVLVRSEKLSPGAHKLDFSASDLSSGIYFYTLTAGDFKETKKMMLVK